MTDPYSAILIGMIRELLSLAKAIDHLSAKPELVLLMAVGVKVLVGGRLVTRRLKRRRRKLET